MGIAAVVQMVSSSNVVENIVKLEGYIKEVKKTEVSLIALPENFAHMGKKDTDKYAIAEVFGQGFIQDTISQFARKYNIWIIAGTIPIKTKGSKVTASSIVYDNKGQVAARYDKIHMFDAEISKAEIYQESATIDAGQDCVVVDTPIGRVGLSVCYDVRFPELYQKLRQAGAVIFSIPSAFTEATGKVHWDILLRARAIENLAYVLAPNQGGTHENSRKTYGHSMIVDPWGKVLVEAKQSGANYLQTHIDLQHLEEIRQRFPCHNHHVL